jgi:hypothetical protein
MKHVRRMALMVGVAVGACAVSSDRGYTQAAGPNAAPNPYRLDEGWAKLPPAAIGERRSACRSIAATGEACGPSTGASSGRSAGTRTWRQSFISIPPAR